MPHIDNDYKIALLDASFFVSEFCENAKMLLSHTKVYAADSFSTEIDHFSVLLSQERQSIYNANIRFLNENVQINTLSLNSFKSVPGYLHDDTWGLLTLLAESNENVIMVTANRLLIQRIMQSGLNADIYDLNSEHILKAPFSSDSGLQSGFEKNERPASFEEIQVSEDSVLYYENGSKLILGNEIKTGLEGTLYLVKKMPKLTNLIKESPQYIAKIFKKDKLSVDKLQNIRRLIEISENLGVDWAVFPLRMLYYDKQGENPAGFVERYVATEKNLDNNPLFLGGLLDIPGEYLAKEQSYAIDLCLKVVRQVCYLNTYGFYISDYNLANFAPIPDESRNIQMWDTDSFGYDSFFAANFSQDYAQSKNHPPYDVTTSEGAVNICNDALYQFVFTVLSLGDAPISAISNKFKYDKPNYRNNYRKQFFPSNLWKHLEEVFRGEKEPSPNALMKVLIAARDNLQNTPADRTFRQLLIDCAPGYEDHLKETEDSRDLEKQQYGRETENKNKPGRLERTYKTEEEKEDKEEHKKRPEKKQGKTANQEKTPVVKIAAIILACLIALGGGSYFVVTLVQNSKGAVDNPYQKDKTYFDSMNYIGWLKNDAISDIEAAGWKAKFTEEYSENVKIGHVIASSYNVRKKQVSLRISKGVKVGKDISITGTVLSANQPDLVMRVGESTTLTLFVSGDYPQSYHLGWKAYIGLTGRWEGSSGENSRDISLTANTPGTGYVRFFIYDSDTAKCVGYTDVFVTVQ